VAARGRPAAGGGRWVEVPPERVARWVAGFAERHGDVTASGTGDGLLLTGADGATADCHLPLGWPGEPGDDAAALVAAAGHDWRVGLLLARRGAHVVGIAAGARLVSSKVDTRYVQGRTAAGGWSQQRFARRRDNQARESVLAAAGHAARILLAEPASLDGLVTGGDRALVEAILSDRRLAPLGVARRTPFLDVPEPRHATLEDAVRRYRSVRVLVREPDRGSDPGA
jgi:hypothetical protein